MPGANPKGVRIPTAVLEKARAVVDERPLPPLRRPAPLAASVKEKVKAALRRLHPMD